VAPLTRRSLELVLVAVFIAGAVFALQGMRFLPSRIMYGRPEWIVIGALMVVGAAVALWRMRRQP
jgi:hypothetical protein